MHLRFDHDIATSSAMWHYLSNLTPDVQDNLLQQMVDSVKERLAENDIKQIVIENFVAGKFAIYFSDILFLPQSFYYYLIAVIIEINRVVKEDIYCIAHLKYYDQTERNDMFSSPATANLSCYDYTPE